MPPKKGAAPDPAALVQAQLALLRDAELSAKAEPLGALAALAAAEAGGHSALIGSVEPLAPLLSETISALAALPTDELTEMSTGAAAVAAQLVAILIGGATAASELFFASGLLESALALVRPPGESWDDATPERFELARHATALLAALCSQPDGCARVRLSGGLSAITALLSPELEEQSELQRGALGALASAVHSALFRAQLRAHLEMLQRLVARVAAEAPAADDTEEIRWREDAMLLLGPCMYDAQLRAQLIQDGLLTSCLAQLELPSDPELATALLRSAANAASVLAIAAQTHEGRELLLRDDAAPALLRPLSSLTSAAEEEEEESPPAPTCLGLLANSALALAHVALSPPGALRLCGLGAVSSLLPLLSGTPPAALEALANAEAEGWAALRQNGLAALIHLAANEPAAADAMLADDGAGLLSLAQVLSSEGTAAGGAEARAKAAELLTQLCRSEAARAWMLGAEGASALTALATSVRRAAADAEGAAGADGVSGAPFADADAAHELEAALCCLSTLAMEAAVRAQLRGEPPAAAEGEETPPSGEAPEPLLPAIVSLLRGGAAVPAAVRRAACSCCAGACHGGDGASASALVQLGAAPALVALARQEGSGASAAAANALHGVCRAMPEAMLWHTGELPMGYLVGEGFYAVTSDRAFFDLQRLKAEPLAAEEAEQPADVLSVSFLGDEALSRLLEEARTICAADSGASADGASADAGALAQLAQLVSQQLGGAIPYEQYAHYAFDGEAAALRASLKSCVLPLGRLGRGGARARALLFKALADGCGLPCAISMGRCVRGAHAHHSWNTVAVEAGVVVVDLLHEVGALYPQGSAEARRYQRLDEFAFSSLTASVAA